MPEPRRTDDSPTLGEIGRRLDELIDGQREFRAEVNTRFDALADTYVRKDVFDAVMHARSEYVTGLEIRIGKLEGNQSWLVRVLIGALIAGAIGALFAVKNAVGA